MTNAFDLDSNLKLHIRDGTSQADRLLPALNQDYFQLADLRFHSLLSMAVDYAGMMKFCKTNNQADGTWKTFFSVDETVVIAMILATDTNKLVTLFNHHQYVAKPNRDIVLILESVLPIENRRQLIAVYCVAAVLDSWFISLSATRNQIGYALHQLIERIISGLKNELQMLLQVFCYYLPNKSLIEFFSQDIIHLLAIPDSNIGLAQQEIVAKQLDQLTIRSSFYTLIKAVEMVQVQAADLLKTSLTSQCHDPATGLLIAFLQLFQRLHQKINRFVPNYIDFYYDQVLGAQAHSFEPDHTFLVARLNNKTQTALVPSGTLFVAGLDDNKQEILYASDETIQIHGARVCAVHTLFFNRDSLNFPENILYENILLPGENKKRSRQITTACWLNTLPIHEEESFAGQAEILAYPVLGAPKHTEPQSVFVEQARFGFVLASKILLLSEGKRSVSITIKFAESGYNSEKPSLKNWINKITDALRPTPGNDLNKNKEEAGEELNTFYKVFKNIFVMHLSIGEGWLPIAEYVPAYSEVDPTLDENCLRLAFTLPAEAPAITPYACEVHGERYQTHLPLIRLTLNPHGYVYPLDILSKLAVASIGIDVSVTGYHSLILHNQHGPLSPSVSFNPFGPLPEIGSYFIVGCPEAAVKQLADFNVDIKWGGLPAGIGGFESLYQGYGGPDTFSDFMISKSILMQGEWFPENAEPMNADTLFKLKNAHHASNELSNNKRISCQSILPYWSPLDYRYIESGLNYTSSRKKGFFKFTLIEPIDAFGHRKYPQNLTQVLTYNNSRQRLFKPRKKEPNIPYTPVITAILVNYRASTIMTTDKAETGLSPVHQDKLIHLHPLGWKDVDMKPGQPVYLLPQYFNSGHLLIGLEALEGGGRLTLYFHLRENSLLAESHAAAKLTWFFLSSNQWVSLTARDIVSDSTHGFMTSGIVTLDIPAKINLDNTILPNEFFWLCVSADQGVENLCSLYSVHAQALKVSRYLGENGREETNKPILFKSLSAGSIKNAKQAIPGLDNFWQMQPSVGGKSSEDKVNVRIRMSERLRHKNRALLPDDYEQLILAYFPQIYKVKCFANLAPGYDLQKNRAYPQIRSGHVTIAALPFPNEQVRYGTQLWLSGHFISEVRNFISQYTPPTATVHFVNPVYEIIQVRCTVKFKNKRVGGRYHDRLNQAISDYLSPWHDTVGYTAHFGWRISGQDVQSFIQQLDYVDRITNFSILKITPESDSNYDWFDSAAVDKTGAGSCEITPKYPWGIAEPMRRHFIEIDDSFETIAAQITGIGELEIGSTFIMLSDNGETR